MCSTIPLELTIEEESINRIAKIYGSTLRVVVTDTQKSIIKKLMRDKMQNDIYMIRIIINGTNMTIFLMDYFVKNRRIQKQYIDYITLLKYIKKSRKM